MASVWRAQPTQGLLREVALRLPRRGAGPLEFDTYDTQVIDSYRTSIKIADYK